MKKWSITLAAFFLICCAMQAQAVELKYKWKKGQTTVFEVDSKTRTSIDMGGMMPGGVGGDFVTQLKGTFGLKINRVNGDGSAEGVLEIRAFKVTDGNGRQMAGLEGLPPGALRNPVDIDTKGRFKFKEIVYLLVDEEKKTSMLISGKAGPNGASASSEVDGERVSVYAEFDPRTGQLKGGYTVEKVAKAKPKKKKVAVRKDAKKVDLLPTQFLEMLQLPEGDLRPGSKTKVRIANYTTIIEVEAIKNGIATIKTTISTEGDTPAPERGAEVEDDEGGSMGMGMGMGMGMPGMPGMGAPDGQSEEGQPAGAPMMKTDGKIVMRFDIKAGQFQVIQGDMGVETSMGGMGKMKSNTTFDMKATR